MLNVGELRSLARDIKKTRNARVRIGVMGDKTLRPDNNDVTNADIGAVHEFGSKTRNIPARSWLRMPIMLYLRPVIEGKRRGFWRSSLSTKGMISTLKKLGIVAENVIQSAFETGGFGHWQDLKPSTIRAKGSSAILIDTAQLRKSVTSKVVNAPSP